MKSLSFNVKRNLSKSPKIYVLSVDKKITYGSFSADNTAEFSGWEALSPAQKSELLQYMQNMQCIKKQFGLAGLNEQTDFRLRLPNSLIQCINEINIMSTENQIEMDIYQPIMQSIIHQLKVTCQKLPEPDKGKALDLLNKIGVSDNKMDYSSQIQKIFSELIHVYMKTEKLHDNALELQVPKSIIKYILLYIQESQSFSYSLEACSKSIEEYFASLVLHFTTGNESVNIKNLI